jgi:predicted nucleic acid-binding protein
MKLLLDTNVLIDYFGQREPYGAVAKQLAIIEAFGDAELWVSAKSYTDVFYVLKKYIDPKRLQEVFAQSLKIFSLCSLEKNDIALACEQQWPDFEDALIDLAAQKVKADYLITRDEGFALAKTPTLTPDQLVLKFKEKGFSYTEILSGYTGERF